MPFRARERVIFLRAEAAWLAGELRAWAFLSPFFRESLPRNCPALYGFSYAQRSVVSKLFPEYPQSCKPRRVPTSIPKEEGRLSEDTAKGEAEAGSRRVDAGAKEGVLPYPPEARAVAS